MFFPPSLTARHQPADQGMIACLKLGYKLKLVQIVLQICHDHEGFKAAQRASASQRNGCKGTMFGNKPHILDAMEILVG